MADNKKMHHDKMTIAFAGGGTGGHVRPIQSLIEYLDKHDKFSTKVDSVVWLGTNGSFENQVATQLAKSCQHVAVNFAGVSSGKIRRERNVSAIRKNFVDVCFRVPRGIIKSLLYCKVYGVDVVFCKGGYVAIPVVIAARILRIPIYVHESDTKAGLTNKIAHRFARKSFTAFEKVFSDAQVVGQILSDSLLQEPNGQEAYTKEYVAIQTRVSQAKQSHKTVVLVSGGSLGSQILYSTLFDQIDTSENLQNNFLFVVVMGMLHDDTYTTRSLPNNVVTIPFVSASQMGKLMQAADIGLVRGGTTTLAECKLFGLPLIIVPLPVTHDQKKNAEYYAKQYKDIVLDQDQSDFGSILQKAILSMSGGHKETKNLQQIEQVYKTKETIIKQLLNIK